ncbi:hypothetical protein KPK64_03820 (plasmid) [Proteus mirabilis]|nr:hypothetical protein KPK64_03820 [Proteus mirabilis]
MALTDEQSQELMDAIIEKCETTVEGVGYCDVVLEISSSE